MDEHVEPRVFGNLYADVVPPGPRLRTCACFDQFPDHPPIRDVVSFHPEQQDTTAPGWQHLLELIDRAATDRREEFRPLTEMSAAECSEVITLPREIANLTSVRHLLLYGSHLVRLPPEVAAMSSLEKLTVYTSYRLHWFPYELIRCSTLVDSSVSTRALYGNVKFRPPFPALSPRPTPASNRAVTELDPGQWGATSADHCSVCARPIDEDLHQVWISLRIATDVLPLLVNACSDSCVQALPTPPNGYVSGPHGGGTLQQPKPRY